MFDSLLHPNKEDAINILKADHDKVDALFKEFEDKDRTRSKAKIIAETLKELRIHATIEEEIFYPTVRPKMPKSMMNEANEEHHVAKVLIAELAVMSGKEEHYEAKFTVLSENIRHHVKEEEHEMFAKVRTLDLDMVALGQKLLARKEKLLKTGIPLTAEERLLATVGATRIDSPALAVTRNKPTKLTKARTPANSNSRKPKPAVALKATGVAKKQNKRK